MRNLLFIATLLTAPLLHAQPPVHRGEGGRLVYEPNERGDHTPDFSSCGYAGADRAIPSVGSKVVVEPIDGDATSLLQAAIDHVASLNADADGFRGSVLLAPGEFRVEGGLRLSESGVVLRGSGADRTTLVATGAGRRPVVRVEPTEPMQLETGEPITVSQAYVPVGATTLQLAAGHGLSAGDAVVVTRPSTEEWVKALGAKADGVGWRAGRQDIHWERTVTAVNGAQVTLDAPITTALDEAFGGGTVAAVIANPWARQIGVEDLTLRSVPSTDNPKDESHSWHGVVANHAEDLWVRRVRFEGFTGGAVLLREGTRRVTVEDCLCLAPVGEIGGYRRHSFFTQGQQSLFLRCWAEEGLHDFAAGHCAAGPNAFVNCYAYNTHGDSGPLESWASGVLYDNVRIDGADLFFGNRWLDPPGAGWSAANCVAWQCQAAQVHCFNPPTAQNWALGFWAQPVGDGELHGLSDFYKPISLYKAQLGERLGDNAAERAGPFLLDPVASTRPTLEEAEGFVAQSNAPARTLRDLIEERLAATPAPRLDGFPRFNPSPRPEPKPANHPVEIVNGWLTVDGKVLTGKVLNPTWWRGTIRPADAPAFGPSVTRYAPGRSGTGLTDELGPTATGLARRGVAAYDHHYGLWYERRRDDHLMVRRATSEVAPPFFEQPFARSGRGRAWDGLSRYDLTKFNAWYWDRLAEFAELCDQKGLLLMHQCYFQHNILEAGAHWADSPWRPVNNVNGTPFSEPPPYVGDKRIFIAHQFYSSDNEPLRELHRGYLKQCVEAFAGRSNVVQFTSGEYTGPLEFTQFWLDQMAAGGAGLVGLAATKDVQDAILADPDRATHVDLIDIRYWCYAHDGQLYAPPGGANMAPRQHLRQSRIPGGDFNSVARAVLEYRAKHPAKPVTFTAGRVCRTPQDGWAVLMAGGSLADVPPLPDGLREQLVGMRPAWSPGDDAMRLVDGGLGRSLWYGLAAGAVAPTSAGDTVRWIDPKSGAVVGEVVAEGPTPLADRVAWVIRAN